MSGLIPRDAREQAQLAAEAYRRLDPEDRLRRFVEQGLPVGPDLARVLLDRLDRRDGCHGREVAIRDSALKFLAVFYSTSLPRTNSILDREARILRGVLAEHAHPGRPA